MRGGTAVACETSEPTLQARYIEAILQTNPHVRFASWKTKRETQIGGWHTTTKKKKNTAKMRLPRGGKRRAPKRRPRPNKNVGLQAW